MLLFTAQHPMKQHAGPAQLAYECVHGSNHTCAIAATQGRFLRLPAGAAKLSKADAAAKYTSSVDQRNATRLQQTALLEHLLSFL
jgi:hypothetical protein